MLPHGLTADLRDAELPQFADDPSQAEASFFGDRQDKLSNLFGLPLPALGILWFGLAVLLFPHPAVERGRAANRNQFLDGSPDGLAVLQQSLPLLVCRVDLLRKSVPQNLVLVFQDTQRTWRVRCRSLRQLKPIVGEKSWSLRYR